MPALIVIEPEVPAWRQRSELLLAVRRAHLHITSAFPISALTLSFQTSRVSEWYLVIMLIIYINVK